MSASAEIWSFARASLAISATVGLISAIVIAVFAPRHVYHVISGYSGQRLWLAFHSHATEKQLFEAVLAREPSLSMGSGRPDEVQSARAEFVSGYPHGDLAMFPFEPGKSPDVNFTDGGRVKGVWLTEPATRTEIPVAATFLVYVVTAAVMVSVFTWCLLYMVRWAWYFLLRRVSEFSSAMRGSS